MWWRQQKQIINYRLPQTRKLGHWCGQTLDEVTSEVKDRESGAGSDGEGKMKEGIVPEIQHPEIRHRADGFRKLVEAVVGKLKVRYRGEHRQVPR